MFSKLSIIVNGLDYEVHENALRELGFTLLVIPLYRDIEVGDNIQIYTEGGHTGGMYATASRAEEMDGGLLLRGKDMVKA